MRIAEGVNSLLQMAAMLARLCKKSGTPTSLGWMYLVQLMLLEHVISGAFTSDGHLVLLSLLLDQSLTMRCLDNICREELSFPITHLSSCYYSTNFYAYCCIHLVLPNFLWSKWKEINLRNIWFLYFASFLWKKYTQATLKEHTGEMQLVEHKIGLSSYFGTIPFSQISPVWKIKI